MIQALICVSCSSLTSSLLSPPLEIPSWESTNFPEQQHHYIKTFNIIPALLVSQQGDKWELWSACSPTLPQKLCTEDKFWYLQQSILKISEPELSQPLHFTRLVGSWWESVTSFYLLCECWSCRSECYPSFMDSLQLFCSEQNSCLFFQCFQFSQQLQWS